MKQGIHPEYVDCVVKCSCGNTFTTRSTKPELKIDICNACHPFYTGTQKLIDTGGRVQRFADRFGAATRCSLWRRWAFPWSTPTTRRALPSTRSTCATPMRSPWPTPL